MGNGPGWRLGLLTGVATGTTSVIPVPPLAPGIFPPSAFTALQPLGLAPLSGATAAPNQFGGGFTSGNGLWDVNGIIDALAGDQLITILAEPNLTALSGETASFLAGGEFPIPIAGNTSNGQTTIPDGAAASIALRMASVAFLGGCEFRTRPLTNTFPLLK